MDTAGTARTYDRIAGHWAADVFNQANGIAQHERALRFCATKATALDVGCGASGRIIDLLLKHGFAVEGLDISTQMLEHARKRHPGVEFHQADICTWEFRKSYGFISAWDSIWHVPLEQHASVFRKLCAALQPKGVLIFTTGGVDAPHEVTNPCHGEPLYHAAPGIPNLLRWIDEAGCVCRHLEYDQLPERHVYLIVQRRDGPDCG